MKKLTALLATAFAAVSLSATAFAANMISADEALAIAQKQVPAGSTHIMTKAETVKQNPHYDVKFYDNATHTEYEVEVLQNNGAIKEFSMDAKASVGSNKITLSTADVQALVQKEFPNAVFQKIELSSDNGLYEYEVEFTAPGVRGEMTFNPESGLLLEKELKYQF